MVHTTQVLKCKFLSLDPRPHSTQHGGLENPKTPKPALVRIRNLGCLLLSLLNCTTDSNIRVVHRVKKRVVGATPAKKQSH